MTADHWKHVARPFLSGTPSSPACPAPTPTMTTTADDDAEENVRRMCLHATALVAGFSFTLGEDDDSVDDDDDDDDSNSQVSTGGDTVQAMVPFWDMLNHVEPESSSVRLNHDEDANTLQMIAIRPHAKGEEVFNTYGAAGDAELLRRYGFVMRRFPQVTRLTQRAECLAAAEFARESDAAPADDDSESDYSGEDDEDDDSTEVSGPLSDGTAAADQRQR